VQGGLCGKGVGSDSDTGIVFLVMCVLGYYQCQ